MNMSRRLLMSVLASAAIVPGIFAKKRAFAYPIQLAQGIATQSCNNRSGLEHSFNLDSLRRYAGMEGCKVIVSYGDLIDDKALELVYSTAQHFPLYVHRDLGVTNISVEDFKAVLRGDVRQWTDIGSAAREITLYCHGQTLNRQVFNNLVQRLGLLASMEEMTPAQYRPDYQSLYDSAALDVGGITVGLRGVATPQLSVCSINHVSPFDTGALYPLRIPIFIYRRHESDSTTAEELLDWFMEIYEQRNALDRALRDTAES